MSQLYGSRISHIPLYMCRQLLKRVYCQTQGDERFQNKEYDVKGTWRSAVTDFLLYTWAHWDLVDEAMFFKIARYLSDITSKSTFPVITYVYAKLPFLCCRERSLLELFKKVIAVVSSGLSPSDPLCGHLTWFWVNDTTIHQEGYQRRCWPWWGTWLLSSLHTRKAETALFSLLLLI